MRRKRIRNTIFLLLLLIVLCTAGGFGVYMLKGGDFSTPANSFNAFSEFDNTLTSKEEQPAASFELLAEQDGYIVANDAEKIGSASVLLGAGRQKKGDPLDFAAGITLHKKRGDYVKKGESLATFYGAADKFEAAAAEYRSGLVYGAEKPEEAPLVYALVTKDGVARY